MQRRGIDLPRVVVHSETAELGALPLRLVAVVCAAVTSAAAAAEPIVGRASVIDGDTIAMYGQRIRFNGIDAPESAQPCLDAAGGWRGQLLTMPKEQGRETRIRLATVDKSFITTFISARSRRPAG